jgi:MFS family permease
VKASFPKDRQFYKFNLYGFLKNLKFFDPFIILFFREMGFTFLEIGTLFSIREIAKNVLEIPTGIIADSFGRRVSMIYAFVSYISSFMIFYFFHLYWAYVIAMLLFAGGEAFRTGTHKAMILEHLKIKNLLDRKVDYYGRTRGWAQIGSAVSSLIAAALVFYTGGYRIVFLASAIPYVFALFLMISYPKELDGTAVLSEKRGAFKKAKGRVYSTLRSFAGIFKSRGALEALVNSSLYDGVFKSVKNYLQPVIKSYVLVIPVLYSVEADKKVSVAIGGVYFIIFILSGLSAGYSGTITSKLGTDTRAINTYFLTGAFLIIATGVLLIFKFQLPSIIIFVLYYMIHNVKKPVNVGYISEKISGNVMAAGLSVESQLSSVFVAALAPLMGYVVDRAGVGQGLAVMAVILAVLYPLVRVGKNYERRR